MTPEEKETLRVEKKRENEKQTVTEMIRIYCHGNHHEREDRKGLCPSCQELADYAVLRTEKCPRMAVKTFCSKCPIHCYRKDMEERITEVMRYAGPRILFHHPVLAMYHLYCTRTGKAEETDSLSSPKHNE
ncbi:MAG: nitrous oxide-stimulated promoter family protein [Clostridia bacterium]|nr:nitrous oxide-stimulated promoter family protein [Clostridia bacterium]